MDNYDHKAIEAKWQKKWEDSDLYRTTEDSNKPKYYVLDMFPYLSGEGLHVGHPKGYIATDIYSRFKRMNGYNVLHPMGWDAFGLPAENYAIKNKINPASAVKTNVERFKAQLQIIGFDYDWSREINTTDPEYYRWTQWIFLQLYKKGLAFESNEPINWCPVDKTGLANEDVEDGRCERCGALVEQKPMRQWMLRITDYKDKLLEDLEFLPKWPQNIKELQKNWLANLHDWVFSRQRYWGEPIPLIHCETCGVVPVPEEELPLKLPDVENYEPTGTGESPLANILDWVNTTCPKCGGQGKRETNTMPQWAGSCWYYLRYIDPKNNSVFVDKDKEKFWMPVDLYVGGAEHATRHLIYARFWHKVLFELGFVSTKEPFMDLKSVGLILASDGRKMSKRWGNVINPNEIVDQFGADSLRGYEMFMGPFDQAIAWDINGLVGVRRFLERVWHLHLDLDTGQNIRPLVHKTIKKITEDITDFGFNTAISSLMVLVNEFFKAKPNQREYKILLQLLAPFAPHVTEELWEILGEEGSIHKSEWPAYDESAIKDEVINIAIQFNGKVRGTLVFEKVPTEDEVMNEVKNNQDFVKYLEAGEIKKTIYVPGKLLSIVI